MEGDRPSPARGCSANRDREACDHEAGRGQGFQIVQFFEVAVADVAAGLVALPNDRSVVVGLITGCGMGKGRIPAPTVRSGEPNAALKQEHRRLIAHAAAAGHIVFVTIAFARPGRSEEHTSEIQSLMRTSY